LVMIAASRLIDSMDSGKTSGKVTPGTSSRP
jgi:hypothetical protein